MGHFRCPFFPKRPSRGTLELRGSAGIKKHDDHLLFFWEQTLAKLKALIFNPVRHERKVCVKLYGN